MTYEETIKAELEKIDRALRLLNVQLALGELTREQYQEQHARLVRLQQEHEAILEPVQVDWA